MKSQSITSLLLMATLVILLAGARPSAGSAGEGGLQAGDCIKCHWLQPQRLAENGGAHASAIGCLDCHLEHPPRVGNTVAACTSCHADLPHFQAGNCLHCHADPHQPLTSLRDPLKPVRKECLSCHGEVDERMAAEPSRHAGLFCNRCHSRHKEIPDCLDCHQGHQPTQTETDCRRCHSAHQPLMIVPVGHVSDSQCRVCHKQAADDLATTQTSHGGINCAYCHQGRHPSTPACQECHGLPHGQVIHSQHRRCLDCHGDSHRLISHH